MTVKQQIVQEKQLFWGRDPEASKSVSYPEHLSKLLSTYVPDLCCCAKSYLVAFVKNCDPQNQPTDNRQPHSIKLESPTCFFSQVSHPLSPYL